MEATPEELAQRARTIVRQRLESLERAGVEQLPKPRLDATPLVIHRASETIVTPIAATPVASSPAV
ncbi:MAG TPA: hypothetical protein VL096_17715, partial [Pirellulaceae bacterium]|nr:hypothetical protein [Pirellulaceae bacterium]